MHGEVVIYILKCQASQNTYVLLNGVFHGKRWNPAQGACLLRPANQHRDAPKPEIIPFICCNWVSISAIKNRWWKTEALDRNTSLLCVCVCGFDRAGAEQRNALVYTLNLGFPCAGSRCMCTAYSSCQGTDSIYINGRAKYMHFC